MPSSASCRRSADGAVRRIHACRHALPRRVPRAEYFWMCAGAMLHGDCRNSPAAAFGYRRGPELAAFLKSEGLAPPRRSCGREHYRSRLRRKPFFRIPLEHAPRLQDVLTAWKDILNETLMRRFNETLMRHSQ